MNDTRLESKPFAIPAEPQRSGWRIWLRRTVIAVVVLLWGSAVSGALWAIFVAVGDTSAAQVSRGITIACLGLWGVLMSLIVLLLSAERLRL